MYAYISDISEPPPLADLKTDPKKKKALLADPEKTNFTRWPRTKKILADPEKEKLPNPKVPLA